jgi:hypothetical protein
MAKLTNVRERVHQPFRDSLIRTSGFYASSVQDRTDLFTKAGQDDGVSNLKNGSTLPSDQSMVVLALRVFTWFRNPIRRFLAQGDVRRNGDYASAGPTSTPTVFTTATGGQGQYGTVYDVYRLNWQSSEQLLWSFGSGEKFSLTSMPTAYFPYGGGLSGDMGLNVNEGDGEGQAISFAPGMIHWQNGTPDHSGILRLARAVLLPPRQNVKVQANIVRLPDGGNGSTFQTSQGSRDMLSLTSNLNALDGIQKCIAFTFDGLFSRDVQ